jgi:hypothetical protein
LDIPLVGNDLSPLIISLIISVFVVFMEKSGIMSCWALTRRSGCSSSTLCKSSADDDDDPTTERTMDDLEKRPPVAVWMAEESKIIFDFYQFLFCGLFLGTSPPGGTW